METPRTTENWLRLAAEARALANTMHNAVARQAMIEIALRYERMATQAALGLIQQGSTDSSAD